MNTCSNMRNEPHVSIMTARRNRPKRKERPMDALLGNNQLRLVSQLNQSVAFLASAEFDG